MVGTLAQLIAFVSHGNAFLMDGFRVQDFYPSNSTFQFCNQVSFVTLRKGFRRTEIEVAQTPNDWFTFLAGHKCQRLSIGYLPSSNPTFSDHKLAGLVGGGVTWQIASCFSKYADYWLSRWEVTDRKAPDKRIWKVTYGRVAENKGLPRFSIDLLSDKDKLESILKRIGTFARQHDLDFWADKFHNALEALTSDDPISLTYHKDLLPVDGYGLDAKRLISACSEAWVFGGMGSWNDLGFEDKSENEQYERLSKDLYETINLCVVTAANSYGQHLLVPLR